MQNDVLNKIDSISTEFEKMLEKTEASYERINLFKTYYELLNFYESLLIEKSMLSLCKKSRKL
ncbi:MAG: hypothetical protein ACPLXN_05135 [Sulfurihydrogenibium sp.]|uniref:hypothetical protein n=1 Tax=Sulfurihydrogenibium sp. TaxID=2053621 RepID=UPI003C7A1145